MDMPLSLQQDLRSQEQLCHHGGRQMLVWLLIVAMAVLLTAYFDAEVMALNDISEEGMVLALGVAIPLATITTYKSWVFIYRKRKLTGYQEIQCSLVKACNSPSTESIQEALSYAKAAVGSNHLIAKLVDHFQPILKQRMKELQQQHLLKALNDEFTLLQLNCDSKVADIAQNVPLIKAQSQIDTTLTFLTNRRQEMQNQWETAYAKFSWWNKIKYAEGPNFSEIDSAIKELTALQHRIEIKHDNDFKALEQHFTQLKQRAIARMTKAKLAAKQFIQEGHFDDEFNASMLNKALWFSAMSIPVSVWADVDAAMDVYDALREVNDSFAAMSNTEIWWESLFMPAESLAGLTALTKGAYFERLIAADTGGQLHEHFNHPDTDIVIDGVAFQLKATDSENYIHSVDESIPVIATSEVAAATGVIDSGYSNEDITNTIENALGGTVIDMGDSATDAILAGLGGLGFFATLQGINHASAKYKNGGDGVEALFEGAGVAIEGTARALVGTAEMGYKVLASRPSRFVGRALLSGLVKLDKKIFEEPKKK